MFIEKINKANDVKHINKKDLPLLAKEIRKFIIENVSETGGHLASNLGVVELTIALHYCLDLNRDKIVWDVGHQSYVHKILTGRKNNFSTLRQLDGLCGFPKPKESKYDSFAAGHSSTSISAAYGMAVARDLKHEKEEIVAVIGDGSFTGGMVYEAMNNVGRSEKDMVVILNDNQMSISDNVGAFSRHLNDLRMESSYLNAKAAVHKLLEKIPVAGKIIDRLISRFKDRLKLVFVPGVLFEEMGFNYLGPIDGHNIYEIIDALESIKKMHGPILLHVRTTKGKGYRFAESHPDKFHGIEKFDIKTGLSASKGDVKSYSSVFGDAMCSLAEKNKKIAAVSAAMISGTGLDNFYLRYPERMFDVGIAEQHGVTFCAGMAAGGMIPVFAVYSTFLQRGYDQILHDVCLQDLKVVFAVDRAGIVGADGETHQGIYDVAFLSTIPNIKILAPRNGAELVGMLNFAVNTKGASAIRYPRENIPDKGFTEVPYIEEGKSEIINDGEKIAILSLGTMFETCHEAFEHLKKDGYNPMLYNARFAKPMDTEMIKNAFEKCDYIFTVEDGIKTGGFGTAVCQWASENGYEKEFYSFGFEDKFIEHGTRAQLFERYGLDADGIYKKIRSII